MIVYLNGQFVERENASISIADAGLQHGIGVFSTLYAQGGKVFRLGDHLARLGRSVTELGLAREFDPAPLGQLIEQTVGRCQLPAARVRVTLTAGAVSLLRARRDSAPAAEPTVLIEPSAPILYDERYFTQGVTVLIAGPLANPFDPTSGHKTLNYWQRLRTLRQAATAGAAEALWLNITNHLASGSVSNIFLVKNETLLTPFAHGEEAPGALPAPVLPGVTRAAVIALAQAQDLPVQKQMLSVNDLLEADEVFLTNSGWQLLPVVKVEKQAIKDGQVGPITQRLREALLQQIAAETASDSDPQTSDTPAT